MEANLPASQAPQARLQQQTQGLTHTWQAILRSSFKSLDALADFLQLTSLQRQQLCSGSSSEMKEFPLLVPRRLAEKMEKGTLHDPLLRQFVPLIEEQLHVEHFGTDPVGEQKGCVSSRLLHKYAGRALLVCTSACAMHCRYCFRRHYPYEKEKKENWSKELAQLAADPSICEVILSGGDPFSLSDRALIELFSALDAIPHLKRLRFHTRFLIGIPERVTSTLCAALRSMRLQVWCVVHCNHPRELDSDVEHALKQLRHEGVFLLNQSVLLRGVNDSVDVLHALSERLLDIGVLPYYLHQLDRVQGAGHYEVPEEEGRALVSALHARLSGYGVPRYVREEEGMPGKTPLF